MNSSQFAPAATAGGQQNGPVSFGIQELYNGKLQPRTDIDNLYR